MNQQYSIYKAKLNDQIAQDKQQGNYYNIIQDYTNGMSKSDLITKYNISWLKIRLILKDVNKPEKISDDQMEIIIQQLNDKSKQKKQITNEYGKVLSIYRRQIYHQLALFVHQVARMD
eukprot:TRINITY_DN2262_c0_g2_i11.p1 TRINITY_DN2262_c0_g2~~TRINITY_DN2262_c0_g2_i11.p1  ORF type:complete len:118 (-),score=24.50 TRINITY_DN2262_c0_g2_i11:7-360(-)